VNEKSLQHRIHKYTARVIVKSVPVVRLRLRASKSALPCFKAPKLSASKESLLSKHCAVAEGFKIDSRTELE
jgi:hypothetical protein